MRKKYIKLMAAGMLILVFMAGCSPIDGANGTVSENADDSGDYAGEKASENDAKPVQREENKNSSSQSWTEASAEELEKELAAYRAEREKANWIQDGLEFQTDPSGNYKYGVGSYDNEPDFDSRELNMAYKVADDYVAGTLKLDSEAWNCVDPRMNAIYEDKDKGVANGYEAENIFLCEYNDNGKWQYLILVREGKGSDWKVLYHGGSYKTKKNDGGDKK